MKMGRNSVNNRETIQVIKTSMQEIIKESFRHITYHHIRPQPFFIQKPSLVKVIQELIVFGDKGLSQTITF